VSSILLSTTHYCVQHITEYNTLLCPTYYWVQHIIVSSILLSTTHYCVQHITVSNILLCPAYYWVQHIIVSSLLLCRPKYCLHTCFPYTLVQVSYVDMLQLYRASFCIDLYYKMQWTWIQKAGRLIRK